jgi:hypothetical protein
MKPTPHDSLDDLIAAALHGELSPEERAQFESRLQSDPNAQAAYQEAKAMHELLEQTNRSAQPDPDFEQRMVSAVRRKLAHPPHVETAWESLVILWKAVRGIIGFPFRLIAGQSYLLYGSMAGLVVLLFVVGFIYQGNQVRSQFTTVSTTLAASRRNVGTYLDRQRTALQYEVDDLKAKQQPMFFAEHESQLRATGTGTLTLSGSASTPLMGANTYSSGTIINSGSLQIQSQAGGGSSVSGNFALGATSAISNGRTASFANSYGFPQTKSDSDAVDSSGSVPTIISAAGALSAAPVAEPAPAASEAPVSAPTARPSLAASSFGSFASNNGSPSGSQQQQLASAQQLDANKKLEINNQTLAFQSKAKAAEANAPAAQNAPLAPSPPAAVDTRKLIRNAQLDLEVKSYQAAFDQVSVLTKAAGGYVDTSNSQRGGNGKLQGTVVVKILPENLDAFLLKLRELGDVQNQQVSTDDVTKDYFDTQARLVNSQKMELQLQDLLKRENGKVSDLLAVERELGRVRGEIEQMQGQLKLYDFQVQYATVTMNIAEKDLNQAAAYLLKEQDNFALYATDVEGAFKKARAAADQFNAQVLAANLEHDVNSDNNQVGASLVVMVAPDQIEPFLAEIRGLGRVANFTRQTERVAKDGGDSSQPADQAKTEKDKVRVQLAIRSDDDTRKQVALTVVAKNVDDALDQAKAAALANAGTEILGSALNTNPDGASTAQLSVRVPGTEYNTLIDAFRGLGRQASLSIQRNDNNGPGANGDDVPVIVSLALTDNDQPVQETDLAISADDVDTQAQQIKQQAGTAGVEIKASSFSRSPDGSELAQMTLRLPLAKYPAFLETLEKSGKVDSLSVQRDDRPNQARADETAPAEIQLQLHNPPAIVPDNAGLWPTLRDTFGQGFGALFTSVRVIGVIIAFLIPWVIAVVFFAWIGRRIYISRRK